MAAGFGYYKHRELVFFGVYLFICRECLRIAFNPFVNTFLQLGQMRDTDPDPGTSSTFSSVKCTSMSVLSEYPWRFLSVDPGQMGDSLTGFVVMSVSVEGVSEGIQKDLRAGLFDACTEIRLVDID